MDVNARIHLLTLVFNRIRIPASPSAATAVPKYRKTGRLDMFGTGNETRDYIHVDDVVPALYLLATTRSSEVVFNVASGVETTIREATEMFAGIVGVPLENVAFNGMIREGDPLNWRADISKISALGYKPEIGMLDGLRGYVDWVNEQT